MYWRDSSHSTNGLFQVLDRALHLKKNKQTKYLLMLVKCSNSLELVDKFVGVFKVLPGTLT